MKLQQFDLPRGIFSTIAVNLLFFSIPFILVGVLVFLIGGKSFTFSGITYYSTKAFGVFCIVLIAYLMGWSFSTWLLMYLGSGIRKLVIRIFKRTR